VVNLCRYVCYACCQENGLMVLKDEAPSRGHSVCRRGGECFLAEAYKV